MRHPEVVSVVIRGVKGSGKTTLARFIEDCLTKAGILVSNSAAFHYGSCQSKPLDKCVESLAEQKSLVRLDIETITPPTVDLQKFELHRVQRAIKKEEGARSPHYQVILGNDRQASIQGLLMHHIVRDGEFLYVHAEDIRVGDQIFVEKDSIRCICIN